MIENQITMQGLARILEEVQGKQWTVVVRSGQEASVREALDQLGLTQATVHVNDWALEPGQAIVFKAQKFMEMK